MLSQFLYKKPVRLTSFAFSFVKQHNRTFATMSPQAVEQEQPQHTDISVQEQIRLAEIERDALDIVKKNRADPAIVEYEAYSHSSASEKKHSLTVSVSIDWDWGWERGCPWYSFRHTCRH